MKKTDGSMVFAPRSFANFAGARGAARAALVLVALAAPGLAQNWFPSNGNVGLGTTSPSYPLHIESYQYGTPTLTYHSGYTMFGLDVPGNVELVFGWLGAAPYGYWIQSRGIGDALPLSLNPLGGYVGIGTTNPGSALDVNGTIMAKEIIVSSTAFPDYVFAPGYQNRPLAEVAAYIEANHRLPGMPAAAEAEAKGVNVGDLQKKLLEKVEELTLHMIAADERNGKLERENQELMERVKRLEEGSGAGK